MRFADLAFALRLRAPPEQALFYRSPFLTNAVTAQSHDTWLAVGSLVLAPLAVVVGLVVFALGIPAYVRGRRYARVVRSTVRDASAGAPCALEGRVAAAGAVVAPLSQRAAHWVQLTVRKKRGTQYFPIAQAAIGAGPLLLEDGSGARARVGVDVDEGHVATSDYLPSQVAGDVRSRVVGFFQAAGQPLSDPWLRDEDTILDEAALFVGAPLFVVGTAQPSAGPEGIALCIDRGVGPALPLLWSTTTGERTLAAFAHGLKVGASMVGYGVAALVLSIWYLSTHRHQ